LKKAFSCVLQFNWLCLPQAMTSVRVLFVAWLSFATFHLMNNHLIFALWLMLQTPSLLIWICSVFFQRFDLF
jgi:hypothetical protein